VGPAPVHRAPPRPLPLWRWATLLGLALLAPAGLPAGGAEPRLPALRRRISQSEPWLSEGLALRVSPARQAPVLQTVDRGVPLRVVRRWLSPSGRTWLQVEVGAAPAGRVRRGWLPG
jgi:hypothetical protein